jgi:hypothetical protein
MPVGSDRLGAGQSAKCRDGSEPTAGSGSNPQWVVRDSASSPKLIDLAERAERIEALRASLADMRAALRQLLAEQQGR